MEKNSSQRKSKDKQKMWKIFTTHITDKSPLFLIYKELRNKKDQLFERIKDKRYQQIVCSEDNTNDS